MHAGCDIQEKIYISSHGKEKSMSTTGCKYRRKAENNTCCFIMISGVEERVVADCLVLGRSCLHPSPSVDPETRILWTVNNAVGTSRRHARHRTRRTSRVSSRLGYASAPRAKSSSNHNCEDTKIPHFFTNQNLGRACLTSKSDTRYR